MEMIEIGGHDGKDLFRIGSEVAPNLVYFLPRNTPLTQLAKLQPCEGNDAVTGGPVYVERHHLNGKLKTLAAYYGGAFRA